MAKSFLFRVTQEGVDELKQKLEALGPSGKAAFDAIANATPRLADSLGQAQGRMDQTRSRLEALKTAGESTAAAFETLNHGLALFGVGLGIEKVIEFGKRAIENVGGLKDLSTQIGVTTRDFQVYQYAARQNGVATQAWQTGLATLTRQIGDATAGNKEAIDLFRRLNIEFKDGAGNARATGDAARDLAQRIHDSSSSAQQFAIANDALGRSGRSLIPILKDGAEGFDKFAASANSAGEVLSDETIERLNRADTTFKNLAAHMEIFFAEGIDNGIEVGKAFANMAEAAANFASRKIDISKITGQIDALQRELKTKVDAFKNGQDLGFSFYSETQFDDDRKRIQAQIEFLRQKLSAITNPPPPVVVPPESSFEKPGRSGTGAFKYKAPAVADPLQAGKDQIAILRQVANLNPAQRSIEEARLTALYSAKRNTDTSVSGAADQFGDQAKTQAILKQTQAISDQNRQIELNTALTGKAADAWMQSDAAGQRADAQRQAEMEALTTGYSAAARAAQILAQEASQAAEKGAQQLALLQQQAADAAAQAQAAGSGPAALAAEQLAQKIATATKSLKASLENATGDDAVRLSHEIDGITDSITRADEAAKKLRLETSLFDQQDEIASLQQQYALVGQISGVQAVQVAHLEAINKLLRDGVDLNSAAARSYVANAEQIASLKDKLEISQREAELQLEPYKNAIQGLQSAWTDGWEHALSGQINSFSDFFSTVKQIGIRWAAEMASVLTFRPVASSILGSIAPGLAASLGFGGSAAAQNSPSVGTAGGLGGFAASAAPLAAMFGGTGGATTGIGSWLFGSAGTGFTHTGAAAGATSGLLGSSSGFSSFFNSGLGTGLIGAGVAAGLTAASGGSGLQTALSGGGALIGGIAGSYFGPLGSMAGSALGGIAGNLLGGLFGGKDKKPPKQQSITNIDALASGYFGAGDTTTKHSGDVTSSLGKNAVNALNSFLASIGGTVSGQQSGQVSYYGRTPRFMSTVGGTTNQFGDDAQGAQDAVADFIARTMVEAAQSDRLDGVSEAVKTAIANSGAKDADALDAAVAFGKFYDRVDKIRTPAESASQALADLTAQMSKAQASAEDYGLDVAKLAEIFKQNFIDDISDQIMQLQDPTAFALKQLEIEKAAAVAQATQLGADLNQVEELYGLKRQAIVEQGLQGVNSSFQDFFDSLLTDSNLSALSPQEQYKVTQAAFEGASNDNVIAAATPFLNASRGMYASSSGYADDFRAVLERVKAAGGLSSDIPAFAQGGDHSGGWMMAGENGPELVASGAARVYDAKTTAAIMSAANADMSPALMARIVKSLGQGPDTELVHLRPDELSAAMTWWGGMSINPVTGLPAFKAGGGQGTSASQGGSKSSGKGSAGGGKPGEDKMAQAQAAAQKSGGAKAASTGSGGAKDFDAASAAAAAAFANSTNLAGPNPGDMAGGGIVGGQGYLGQGGTAGNQGSSTLGRDAVDRGWAAYGTQAWSDQQQKVKAAVAAGVSPADITAAATAYAQRLNDYTDRDNSTGEDIANYVASFFGFNEIAPSLDFSNLNPNADWGFDPAGLIGSIVGSALGLPVGGGIIADFISKSMGRPLEMNLGPSVFGDDSQTVTDGVSNALSVQGASDISLGGSTFSANTAMNSPAAGVLSGGDIPRALSSVVNGGQNSVTGGLQSISDRTAQGNETLIQQVQALIRVNKTMSDQLQQLVNSGSLNTEALKQQARGSNQLLSRP